MAKVGFIRNEKDWKGFSKAIDPKNFSKEFRKHITLANKRAGAMAVTRTRKVIQGGVDPVNHALTVAIKGSSKPLVDQGDLFGSITWRAVDWKTVFVGVLRTDRNFNVGMIIHEGGEAEVTESMRRMFFVLWLCSEGKMNPGELVSERAQELWSRYQSWRPIKKGTKVIVIPSRPFLAMAFDDPELKARVMAIWNKALEQVFQAKASEGRLL